MRRLLIALTVVSPLGLPLSAQELWVDAANGSDLNPGTASSPFESISFALTQVLPGETIFVLPGTYSMAATNEQFPIQIGTGAAHQGVTIHAFDGAILDLANARGTAMQVGTNADGGRITNLTFMNMDKTDWWTTTISAGSFNGSGSATGFEVDRCRFIDVNRGIVLWQGMPIVGWRIHDNLFLRLGNDGINEFDPLSANQIHDNTFVGNAHLGVLSDADQTLIANNIFASLRVGIASGGSSSMALTRVRANDFWQNSVDVEGAAFPGGTVPPGNYNVDPRFVSPTSDDYHLSAQSQLIDGGDLQPAQRADLDNVPGAVDSDLNGSVVTDVGAYERTPVTVTASAIPGASLTFRIASSNPSLTVGVALFGLDEGVINLPGISPILISQSALIVPAFVGGMPYGATLAVPPFPAGSRLVIQGFGFDPANARLPGGQAVRLQF